MTYAFLTEWMNQKERDNLDRQLAAADSASVSRGTRELLAVMGVRIPAPEAVD